MTPVWYLPRPPIPTSVLVLSFGALLVPVLAELFAADLAGEYQVLLWLLALIPSFMLAYYRGWLGAATALAAGMAVLSLTQAAIIWAGGSIRNGPLLLLVVVLYGAIALGNGWVSELLHRQRAYAERMALTDDLTKLPNRRFAQLFLEKEFAAAERGRPLTVVLFDLDHFKAYNDLHGHAAGDAALVAFGELLGGKTRKMDFSARYGGEEFLTVLSSCAPEGALAFVERVRAALGEIAFPAGPITVSVGVAGFRPGMTTHAELLAAADRALYAAKEGGRDCVRMAEMEGEPSGVEAHPALV
jgi:diguanylate cyclase (GGDEF)-like protein